MVFIETLFAFAAEVAAVRVLWAEKILVSIPAFSITFLIHRLTVSRLTGLKGLAKRSQKGSSPSLTDSVSSTYRLRQVTTHRRRSAGYDLNSKCP